MNERIKELAKSVQCERHWTEEDIEKFAELIVQECQDRVEHYIRDCGEIASLPDSVIKEHFGVE